nr:uncharacterized protein LOC111509649 isoform X1 [Leptinotarsa decemlineata]
MFSRNIYRVIVMGEYNRRRRVTVDLDDIEILPSKVSVEKLLQVPVGDKENVLNRNNKSGLRKRKQSGCSPLQRNICVKLPDPNNDDCLSCMKGRDGYRKPLVDLFGNRQESQLFNHSKIYGSERRIEVSIFQQEENLIHSPTKKPGFKENSPRLTKSDEQCETLKETPQRKRKPSMEIIDAPSPGVARTFSFICFSNIPENETHKQGFKENSPRLTRFEEQCEILKATPQKRKRSVDTVNERKILQRIDGSTPGIGRTFSFIAVSKSSEKKSQEQGRSFTCSTPINPSKMSERRGTKGLELWCKKMTEGYPGVKIDNMTTSWRDGLAFCAIIHHFRPDLIDFSKLHKDDVYHNNELAFRVAEHHLGIPALLEPEDMVEYSVPDRLSILTYLSQFYQAFAVPQGSAARIAPKRPQTVPDHGIVSPASTSPPKKMALTSVGKLRREPCTKCALPVFIAERLNVGKLLFHRTCFRCARCDSQLTLANYYETENSEFCCEICPDEEKLMSKKATETLLLRSLSDEEKSASLKMITNDPDEFSTMFETALESVGGDKSSGSDYAQARSQFFKAQIESSDSGADEEPPDLPKSSPPDLPKSSPPDLSKSSPSDLPKSSPPNLPKSSPPDLPKSSPPDLSKSSPPDLPKSLLPELAKSDKTDPKDIVVDSARSDSSFPDRPTSVNISTKVSVNKRESSSPRLDESRNVVTKDVSAQEGDVSLVKARMRLFESNHSKDSDISKSDVYRKSQGSEKVPKKQEKSPVITIPLIRLEELENFDDRSNREDDKIIAEPIVSIDKDETKHSIQEDIVSNKDIVEETPCTNQEPEVKPIQDSPISDKTENVEPVNEESIPAQDIGVEPEDSIIIIDSMEENVDDIILVDDSPQKTDPPVADANSEMNDNINDESVIAQPKESEYSFASTVSVITSDDSEKSPSAVKEDEEVPPLKGPCEEESPSKLSLADNSISSSFTTSAEYPAELDPFGEEAEDEVGKPEDSCNRSLNPFGSEDEEEQPEPKKKIIPSVSDGLIKGTPDHLSRVHVERISINPFDEDPSEKPSKPLVSPRMRKKKVIPNAADRDIQGTPDHLAGVLIERVSVNPFESPKPVARKKKLISPAKGSLNPFSSDDEDQEEEAVKQPVPKPRVSRTSVQPAEPKPRETGQLSLNTKINFGSNSSISSGSAYGSARKKKPAPRPPIPTKFDESANSSLTSSPNHSLQYSPHSGVRHKKNKKAPAPPVPKFASTPVSAQKMKDSPITFPSPIKMEITEDAEIRKKITDDNIESEIGTHDEKDVKDEMNRNRRSQDLSTQKSSSDEHLPSLSIPNKSTYGKWKRRKGQAPSKPIPQKRTIKCLPMAEIRRELEFIEIQQQGLEKQGVRLEQIIREKCEGTEANTPSNPEDDIPIDVEDLILQLFELVNEKNELFRKQTELMYLRRQQRLEEEHADVEYQIRCLMLQPEANKTDSDKTREEELIKRLIDIVERRNEIVECLEMDRVREAEEDDSISSHINMYALNRDVDKSISENPKKEKDKDKKKHKKEKKSKHKSKDNVDMDKDVDESETYNTLEKKKKKKFALF